MTVAMGTAWYPRTHPFPQPVPDPYPSPRTIPHVPVSAADAGDTGRGRASTPPARPRP